jgi:hypothetical protein
VKGPSAAFAAVATLTAEHEVFWPTCREFTPRPAGGARGTIWYVPVAVPSRTTWTGTSTVLPWRTTSFASPAFSAIGCGRVTAAERLTNGRQYPGIVPLMAKPGVEIVCWAKTTDRPVATAWPLDPSPTTWTS